MEKLEQRVERLANMWKEKAHLASDDEQGNVVVNLYCNLMAYCARPTMQGMEWKADLDQSLADYVAFNQRQREVHVKMHGEGSGAKAYDAMLNDIKQYFPEVKA
ncbi:hypothetical protein C4573_05350 [Candidatus Woesearchaeota archaeon]|nr:MAG: hypothetical protein C4573_05350 [Candidatus Woesearchaeota archaeon]